MDILLNEGYATLFLIVAVGIILGRIKLGGYTIGSSAVILIAMVFGHFGFMVPEFFGTVGLLLFIFTIATQSGPGLINTLNDNGKQLAGFTVCTILTAALITLASILIFDINSDIAVGLFAGALTSTPGLAAALDATGSEITAVGYGLAYPFGIIGLILLISLLPKILRINIEDEEKNYRLKFKKDHPGLNVQDHRIENSEINGKTLREINLNRHTGLIVSRVRHGKRTCVPDEKTVLHIGDIVRVVASREDIEMATFLFGPKVHARMNTTKRYDVRWVLVNNKEIINKRYRDINLNAIYNIHVLKIKRSGIELTPRAHSRFRYGDRLLISGSREAMVNVTKIIGTHTRTSSVTDFLPIFLGITLGILLGTVEVPVFGLFDFKLGITGGVLISGLALSLIGKTGPVIWAMSGTANNIIRQFGLLMFMGSVGTRAGAGLSAAFMGDGLLYVGIGVAITVLPIIITPLIARYLFKMNFLTVLGMMTGTYTSSVGLGQVQSQSSSNAAPAAYAAVFPIALVIIIITANLLALL